jgi:hypothetical protein
VRESPSVSDQKIPRRKKTLSLEDHAFFLEDPFNDDALTAAQINQVSLIRILPFSLHFSPTKQNLIYLPNYFSFIFAQIILMHGFRRTHKRSKARDLTSSQLLHFSFYFLNF